MLPLVTLREMRDADERAVSTFGLEALIRRAGVAVGQEARRMLGSCYGARVAVLTGPGHNGDDGRAAAAWLVQRGARVTVLDARDSPDVISNVDLLIDAAFGSGGNRAYVAPLVESNVPVLAVDLPSGVNPDTGEVMGRPLTATVTLALGALKFAHVDGPGQSLVGDVRLARIGIEATSNCAVMEEVDLTQLLRRQFDEHKWMHALEIVAGSTFMPGAAALACRGALATGASMIRLHSVDVDTSQLELPEEVVRVPTLELDTRCRAAVVGPGIGGELPPAVLEELQHWRQPLVLDADGLRLETLDALGEPSQCILTPHDGEFARLMGRRPGVRRIEDARELARRTGATVLLKGPRTIVTTPSGEVRVVWSGTAQLATAGSGDVLSGVIGALAARGFPLADAAALGAELHGRASRDLEGYATASDVATSIAHYVTHVIAARSTTE